MNVVLAVLPAALVLVAFVLFGPWGLVWRWWRF